MKNAVLLVVICLALSWAKQVPVDFITICESNTDCLQYDDGTPGWITWGGVYRGVWFNVNDFYPEAVGTLIYQSEFWFYHHASYPWDTCDVYLEVWNGDLAGPTTLLDRTLATATHYSPVFVPYIPPLEAETEFCLLVNTELSAGCWPGIIGDGTPGTHSFYGDDFTVWEPWGVMGDYFIRVYIDANLELSQTSWGSLKLVF